MQSDLRNYCVILSWKALMGWMPYYRNSPEKSHVHTNLGERLESNNMCLILDLFLLFDWMQKAIMNTLSIYFSVHGANRMYAVYIAAWNREVIPMNSLKNHQTKERKWLLMQLQFSKYCMISARNSMRPWIQYCQNYPQSSQKYTNFGEQLELKTAHFLLEAFFGVD